MVFVQSIIIITALTVAAMQVLASQPPPLWTFDQQPTSTSAPVDPLAPHPPTAPVNPSAPRPPTIPAPHPPTNPELSGAAPPSYNEAVSMRTVTRVPSTEITSTTDLPPAYSDN